MALFKRGNYWWVKFNLNGKQFRKTTGHINKESAQAVHDEIYEKYSMQSKYISSFNAAASITKTPWADLIYSELNKNDGGFVGLLCRRAKSRAKVSGKDFFLNYKIMADLLIGCNGRCSVTNSPLDFFGESAFKPSVDRIKNEFGYLPDNVRITCAIANMGMNKWGEKDLLTMCAHYTHKILLLQGTV